MAMLKVTYVKSSIGYRSDQGSHHPFAGVAQAGTEHNQAGYA